MPRSGSLIHLRSLRVVVLVVGTLFAATTRAAPEAQGDPLLALLAERGALPAGPGLVSGMQTRAGDIVIAAMNFVGVPYQRGGNNHESGFDCSGFTRHIFGLTLGLALPRRVDDQAGAEGMVSVPRSELRPGDLVFFNTLKRTFSHVGIYVGDGRFIHAPRSGSEVRLENMRYAYWTQRFTGARRVAEASMAGETTPASSLR
jgi:cell wall-associated NlpC family hydrolase